MNVTLPLKTYNISTLDIIDNALWRYQMDGWAQVAEKGGVLSNKSFIFIDETGQGFLKLDVKFTDLLGSKFLHRALKEYAETRVDCEYGLKIFKLISALEKDEKDLTEEEMKLLGKPLNPLIGMKVAAKVKEILDIPYWSYWIDEESERKTRLRKMLCKKLRNLMKVTQR